VKTTEHNMTRPGLQSVTFIALLCERVSIQNVL